MASHPKGERLQPFLDRIALAFAALRHEGFTHQIELPNRHRDVALNGKGGLFNVAIIKVCLADHGAIAHEVIPERQGRAIVRDAELQVAKRFQRPVFVVRSSACQLGRWDGVGVPAAQAGVNSRSASVWASKKSSTPTLPPGSSGR